MRPNKKHYKNFRYEKRWERIDDTHVLVSVQVSKYIRRLEKQCGIPKEEEYVAKRRLYNKFKQAIWQRLKEYLPGMRIKTQ